MFARVWVPIALLLASVVLVLGAGEYRTLQRALRSEIDHNLQSRAHWVGRELQTGRVPAGLMVPGNFTLEEIGKLFVEVYSRDGQLLASSSNLIGSHIPRPGELRGGYATVYTHEGSQLRVFELHLQQPPRVIRVAESLELAERSLRSSGFRILALAVAVTSLSALLLRFLLQRSLRPLQNLAEVARQIVRSGDVSIRADSTGGSQETIEVSQALNGLLERVEELLQAQQKLLQDTSHELRNPLTVLKMDLDVLARTELDEATRNEVAEEAQGELNRLIRLVEDLLLISWAEGRPAIHLEPVDLREVADNLVQRYAALKGERHLEVVGPSVQVLADPLRLDQILRNLLDNAVRYTGPTARITIWILPPGSTERSPVEKRFLVPTVQVSGERVTLVVQDDGCGIDPIHWEQLFQRFYRLESDRNRTAGGTGLGLPLARALARAMGGDLWVYSEPGKGSSFLVSLGKVP